MKQFVELAAVWRGDVIESRHWGVAAVANLQGEVIEGWGDIATITYPRSSMKPFQALPLVETGAADAYRLTTRHLALACASHRGERHHTALVGNWLNALGLSSDDLACGPEYPRHGPTRRAMIEAGEQPCSIHHNCSGKHSGFLTVCRHCGYPIDGYDDLSHSAQHAYAATLDAFGIGDPQWGIDACTLPTPALSVGDAARIAARFMAVQGNPRRHAAAERLLAAMRAHPEYTAGTDHPMGRVVQATDGRVVFKGGAEAFLLAFLEADGLAIAIKVADGNSRARVPALIAILQRLGVVGDAAANSLTDIARPDIRNSRGEIVGFIRAAADLSGMTDPADSKPATHHGHAAEPLAEAPPTTGGSR